MTITNRKTFPIIVNADFYAGHSSYIIGLFFIFSDEKKSIFETILKEKNKRL